jgi:hypothetical protein
MGLLSQDRLVYENTLFHPLSIAGSGRLQSGKKINLQPWMFLFKIPITALTVLDTVY